MMRTEEHKNAVKVAAPDQSSHKPTNFAVISMIAVSLGLLSWFVYISFTATKEQVIYGRTMGTYYGVKYVHTSSGSISPGGISQNQEQEDKTSSLMDSHALQQAIDSLLKGLNQEVSTYEANSEIIRFNRSSSLEPQKISGDFYALMVLAKRVHELSRGAFDPTLAPLINVWGFGEETKRAMDDITIPEKALLARAAKRVGFGHIVLLSGGSIQKRKPDVSLNLSAIAKGYGVDMIASHLETLGIHDYFVDIGGETRGKGKNYDGKLWSVGIETPLSMSAGEFLGVAQSVERVVFLDDISLATSGTYRNFFAKEGKRYSHILDPRSSFPIDHSLVSVSVLAKSCALADALATALLVLGEKEGMVIAKEHDIAALFVVGDPDNPNENFEVMESSNWKSFSSKNM